jgi:predicted thioesterase
MRPDKKQVINCSRNHPKKGRYLMDYSRVYGEPYDITEKARKHIMTQKGRFHMLKTGLKGHQEMTVTADYTAKAMGSGSLDVFATPAMIALMEKTAFSSVQEYLEEGSGTVGTKVDIEHVSASPLGMKITCDSELVEVQDRKLVFTVEAHDETGLIGKGTHERFIINNEKFQAKTNNKAK